MISRQKGGIISKGMVLIAIPLIFIFVFLGVFTFLLKRAHNTIELQVESKEVLSVCAVITRVVVDLELTCVFYNANRIPQLKDRYYKSAEDLRAAAKSLEKLCASDNRRKVHAKQIKAEAELLIWRLNKFFLSTIDQDLSMSDYVKSAGDAERIAQRFLDVFDPVDKLVSEEHDLHKEDQAELETIRSNLKSAVTAGLILNVVLSLLLAFYLTYSISRRIATVRENTERLIARRPLLPSIGGNDEIGALDTIFHSAAQDLQEVDHFREQLVLTVRNQLQTPLAHVKSVLHLLSEGILCELTEKAQSRVDTAEKDAQRLLRLINDLLDVQKMETAKFELQLRPVPVARILTTARDAVAAVAERDKITINVPATSLVVMADEDRIVQVVVNLFSNAVKFSPPDSVIEVSVSSLEGAQGNTIQISVADKGRGVPRSMQAKIFERFQQVELTDASKKGGTGLGLPISKMIVEQHGGVIGVTSESGRGSIFWFRLSAPTSD